MLYDLINTISADKPLDDELFLMILEQEDPIDKQKLIEAARAKCRKERKLTEFNNMLRVWSDKQAQIAKSPGGNVTKFSGAPLVLNCGEWEATDRGIYKTEINGKGVPYRVMACPHPILPTERLVNIDGREKLRLAYYKDGKWRDVIVDCATAYDRKKIMLLADLGVLVTSENACHLVKYISDVVTRNMDNTGGGKAIPLVQTVSRFGWVDDPDGSPAVFVPYADDIRCDAGIDFASVADHVHTAGAPDEWFTVARDVRKNALARITLDASLASPLIDRIGALPFILHLWGGSENGKTVATMVGLSVWGDPRLGAMLRVINSTELGLAGTASFYYNIPLGADELQTIKDKIPDLDPFIMSLTEGVDRGRGTVSGGVRKSRTWQNCFCLPESSR